MYKNTYSASELNSMFANGEKVRFVENLTFGPVLKVDSENFNAEISLWGGQVLGWRPKHANQEVLWSPLLEKCRPNRAIRGGVPICWPWFGSALAENNTLPPHGYARIAFWSLKSIDNEPDGSVRIMLQLENIPAKFIEWHERLRISECITVGDELSIEVTTKNVGLDVENISEGFHTYFNISDISNIYLTGLENNEYFDLITSKRHIEDSRITFSGEFGRVYLNSSNSCYLYDKKYNRRISIDKKGSNSTAVWNPWGEKAALIDDLGPTMWRRMICVEAANTMDNIIKISPSQEHSMSVTYSVTDCKF